MSFDLSTISLSQLKGIGPKTLARLEKLGIYSVQDLIFHLPFRYEDRTQISSVRSLQIGTSAGVVGTITATEIVRRGRTMFLCQLADDTGCIKLRFFNFAQAKLQFLLRPGVRLYCYGEVHYFGTGYEMVHPEYKILRPDELPPICDTLTPIYPTTDGLPQFGLQKIIYQALAILQQHGGLPEYLPAELLAELKLPHINNALFALHQPAKNENLVALSSRQHPWRQRLIFEELLAQQLCLLQLRSEVKTHAAIKINWEQKLADDFIASLPFSLTSAQQRVCHEIAQDLAVSKPMLRLLQGDVGCGKTIVAAMLILQLVKNGYQAAIMAPTELLAEQHYQNMLTWLTPFNLQIGLITGRIKGKVREAVYAEIAAGKIDVIVGTHAIFQEQVRFAKLALAIIDEQHRFGVHQRMALRDKGFTDGKYPHQLIMTATPIPRTLAMTIYADLDLSIIDELPPGRIPVQTIVLPCTRRAEIVARVREHCNNGSQAYWVCPLIEESEILQCQAAEQVARELTASLPELRIGLIHGRMKDVDKVRIMQEFKSGKINLLVATTVIEVGVDVPNASLMIIENAERHGLVQLHQLRGRIGRGKLKSYCVLLYQLPLSLNAKERLQIMRATNDGFELARKDLAMRGPGEVLGVRQTGILQLKIADLVLDQGLLPLIQEKSLYLQQMYQTIIPNITARWIGAKRNYGMV